MRTSKKLHRISEKSDGTVPYEPEELKKNMQKCFPLWLYNFLIEMISANQDNKLKRIVKKGAISLIYQFLFSISKKNF